MINFSEPFGLVCSPSLSLKRTMEFECKAVTVGEFVQKVYVITYRLNHSFNMKKKDINYFLLHSYSKNWVENSLADVQSICGYDSVTKSFPKAVQEDKKSWKKERNKRKEGPSAEEEKPVVIDNQSGLVDSGRETLHQKRHNFILGWISSLYEKEQSFSVLDFGAAQGVLAAAIAKNVRVKIRFESLFHHFL